MANGTWTFFRDRILPPIFSGFVAGIGALVAFALTWGSVQEQIRSVKEELTARRPILESIQSHMKDADLDRPRFHVSGKDLETLSVYGARHQDLCDAVKKLDASVDQNRGAIHDLEGKIDRLLAKSGMSSPR